MSRRGWDDRRGPDHYERNKRKNEHREDRPRQRRGDSGDDVKKRRFEEEDRRDRDRGRDYRRNNRDKPSRFDQVS